ncbi:MAG: transglutaminase-like cysteine peptidase [Gammaproteobacteria bacterium]
MTFSSRFKSALIIIFLISSGVGIAFGWDLGIEMLDKIAAKSGDAARQRILAFKRLIETAAVEPDLEKLQKVNDFFNRHEAFVNDSILWNSTDYWATPIEFLLKGAGDCEDFSIAKYFTLVEMGVDENKLRITYVTARKLNQAHMVLTYYESPQAIPLVLDNLDVQIKPATERDDLTPVYSFNGSDLWLAKNKASGNPVGSANQLSLWQDLKQRILEN